MFYQDPWFLWIDQIPHGNGFWETLGCRRPMCSNGFGGSGIDVLVVVMVVMVVAAAFLVQLVFHHDL